MPIGSVESIESYEHAALRRFYTDWYRPDLMAVIAVGDFRSLMVERLYNRMLNNRLFELTQQPDPPFMFASSGQGRLIRSKEVYVLGASVADGAIEL